MSPSSNADPSDLPRIDSLWNFSKPQETEQAFRALLPKAVESDNRAYYAELLTQLARTLGLQMKFDEAHAVLDSARKEITEDMPLPKVRYYLERGRAFNSSGKKPEASEQFRNAYDLARASGLDFYAVDAAHMLGISEPSAEQLKWNMLAMQLAEQSSDERSKNWLGPLYNNNGWTYHDLEQYEKALELFQKSLAWREARQDQRGTFIAKWTIARAYRSLHRIEDALEVQYGLLADIEAGKAEKDGYVYEELGELLLIQGKKAEAAAYFATAWQLLAQDQWLQANEAERLQRLKDLGEAATGK